jgi:uncharacterized membrane protein
MGFMMLIVWLPLLVILLWALRQFGQPSRDNESRSSQLPPEPDAGEIARRAYARGEIDRERYQQIMQDLGETQGGRSTSR